MLHAVFWMLTGYLIVNSFSIESQEVEVLNGVETVLIVRNDSLYWQLVSVLLLAFVLAYANLWNLALLNRERSRRKAIRNMALLLVAGVVAVVSITTFGWFGEGLRLPRPISFGVLFFYLAISTAYGLAREWQLNQQRQQRLVLEKKQAELMLLRNQLQPHFLFNALNNLLYMVDQQQFPKLADGFERLSQLLRYVVEEPPKGKVAMKKELEFLRNYAAMQLLRFEEGEVNFKLDVKGDFDAQLVEPGLFLPFVENAFKYGTEPEKQSNIQVDFDLTQSDVVVFKIANHNFRQQLAIPGTGSGIATTRRRLHLTYPQKHTLSISEEDPFIVELSLHTA